MSKIIGITGGISTGKSNVINTIKQEGYKIISSDEVYKTLALKGNIIYNNILKTFGDDYLDNNGNIDKHKLGKLIYNNEELRLKLNSITHPFIKDEIKKEIKESNDDIIFIEIPLLFEVGWQDLCDKIILCYLNKEEQIKRLMARDKIFRDYAISKINSQMNLEDKKALSDYIIDTKGSFAETKIQTLDILKKIKEL